MAVSSHVGSITSCLGELVPQPRFPLKAVNRGIFNTGFLHNFRKVRRTNE